MEAGHSVREGRGSESIEGGGGSEKGTKVKGMIRKNDKLDGGRDRLKERRSY